MPEPTREQTCETCQFWLGSHRECRRHAPVAASDEPMGKRAWPQTEYDDWCGDYQPRIGGLDP